MQIDFWLDPLCPWCWMTSRWITQVAPHRDLDIRWRSISLKLKNPDVPDPAMAERFAKSHRLLRVLEAVKTAHGDGPIGDLYTEYGKHIHKESDLDFDPAIALSAIGLDRELAAAAAVEEWDAVIQSETDAGLALAGDDVGTPIIGLDDAEGNRVGIFGPVLSRSYDLDTALQLWDGVAAVATVPGFWEMKRTRTEGPAEGFRPPG